MPNSYARLEDTPNVRHEVHGEDEVDDEHLLEVADDDAPDAEVEELAVERRAALAVEALEGLERPGREGRQEEHEREQVADAVLLQDAAHLVEDVLQQAEDEVADAERHEQARPDPVVVAPQAPDQVLAVLADRQRDDGEERSR